MHVPYSMDDNEPDFHCGMGGRNFGMMSDNDNWESAHHSYYTPTPEEISAALADADEMNYNMRTFGTIDRPKGLFSQSEMDKVIQHNLKAVRAAYESGYDAGFEEGYQEGNHNCQHR